MGYWTTKQTALKPSNMQYGRLHSLGSPTTYLFVCCCYQQCFWLVETCIFGAKLVETTVHEACAHVMCSASWIWVCINGLWFFKGSLWFSKWRKLSAIILSITNRFIMQVLLSSFWWLHVTDNFNVECSVQTYFTFWILFLFSENRQPEGNETEGHHLAGPFALQRICWWTKTTESFFNVCWLFIFGSHK